MVDISEVVVVVDAWAAMRDRREEEEGERRKSRRIDFAVVPAYIMSES